MCAPWSFSRFFSLLFICILLHACKKSDSPDNNNNNNNPPAGNLSAAITPVGTPVGSATSKTIGPAGGSISSPDGRMELNIPAGALSTNTNISVQPITNTAPGGIGLSYDLLPNGTTFSKPATLTFHYTKDDLPDNLPYFLYIAYQESSGKWNADMFQRDFDSSAKTVSLDINHFTIFTVGHEIQVSGNPTSVRKSETSLITVSNLHIILSGSTEIGPITIMNEVPASLQETWKVNGDPDGNNTDGTITRSGNQAVYKAPANITSERTVRVSVLLVFQKTVYKKGGKIIEFSRVEKGVDIKLVPDKEYNFTVSITILDSTISPFYGGLKDGLPIYFDTAKFDVNIKAGNTVNATVSNIRNGPPAVNPAAKAFQGTLFVWVSDPVGEINITSVIFPGGPMPADSVLSFSIVHSGAYFYGVTTKNAQTGEVYSTVPPAPFPGLPQSISIDLKRPAPYLSYVGLGGKYIYTAVIPK